MAEAIEDANPAASGERTDVLDHGYVRLVESMGSDLPRKKLRFRAVALPRKSEFLAHVRDTGSIISSCRALGLSRYSVTGWRQTDLQFDSCLRAELAIWRGTNGVRRCLVCTAVKPVDQFRARSDRAGQQKSTCTECYRIQGRQSYARNKERAFFAHKATRTKSRASSLKLPCDVDAEYLETIWLGRCPIFDVELKPDCPRGEENAPELDRLIPSRGYVRGNVTWVSRRANRIKNNVTPAEMRKLIAWFENALQGCTP